MKDYSEALAKAIVERVLPGSQMDYNFEQSSGECDFTLKHQNGVSAPLEVTRSANQPYIETEAAITSPKKGGNVIKLNQCKNDWYVYPEHRDDIPPNINKIRDKIDDYLFGIEQDGLSEFNSYIDAGKYDSVRKIYSELSIEAGTAVHCKEPPGYVDIALPGQGAWLSSQHVLDAVSKEAYKEDNRKKLGANGESEAHIFIYIDPSNFQAWASINDEKPPQEIPILPPEITHVWCVAYAYEFGKYVVWRASKKEPWSKSIVEFTKLEMGEINNNIRPN